MTLEALLALLAKGIATGIGSQIAKRGFEGVVEWVRQRAKEEGIQFEDKDRELIEKILDEDKSLKNILLAQLKTVNRKGIVVIGPSGAGKTALCNYLTDQPRVEPLVSTPEREHDTARFGARYIRITDTPGSYVHVNLRTHTYDYIEKHQTDILIIMLAYGYLDTIGIPDLRRPGERQEAATLEKYLEKTRLEELEWLEDLADEIPNPRHQIPYCMVVLNKMDHWYDEVSNVMNYYEEGVPKERIDVIVNKFCRPDVKASFHTIACAYDSFKGKAPTGNVSSKVSSLSLALLRAEVARRL